MMDNIIRLLADSTSTPTSEKWSSLTGIVTAICGNILISFALNTQRYAHLRLSREREERQNKQKQARERRQQKSRGDYGTQQSEVAEERAKANREASPERYRLMQHDGAEEEEPLIPRVDVRRRSPADSERSSEVDEKDDGAGKERSYLRSPVWWLGITMMTLGEAGNFLAYGFAPASIVSPLGVVALVSNCLIAPLLLHERFRWRDGVGVIIAVAGCVTVVLSATTSNPKLTPEDIWNLITQWEFETYLGITVVLIIALSVASNKFGERTILIDLGLVGLYGGYTALSTKGVASLLTYTIWRVVTFPVTYLLVAVLVFTAVMQIKYVNRALQRFNATMVIPTQFVMFTISVIVGSAILYRDFERTTPEDAVEFIAGCALTFLGVWCITSGRQNEVESDEEMGMEGEDAIDLVDEEGTLPEVRERDDRRPSLIAVGSSQSPLFQRQQTTGSLDGVSDRFTSRSSLDTHAGAQASLVPANVAAIHPGSTDSLPFGDDRDQSRTLHPPPMHATTSAPQIPTLDTRPKTPLRRGVTGPVMSERIPPSTPSNQYLDPTHNSPRLLNRHSVAGLLPAPYTSPLSSSLSAIVADSLRRGTTDTINGTIGRPLRPGKRKPDAAPPKRHSVASGEMVFEGDGREIAGASRTRSLSATLGDLFRGNKRPRTESSGGADETIAEAEGGEGPLEGSR